MKDSMQQAREGIARLLVDFRERANSLEEVPYLDACLMAEGSRYFPLANWVRGRDVLDILKSCGYISFESRSDEEHRPVRIVNYQRK